MMKTIRLHTLVSEEAGADVSLQRMGLIQYGDLSLATVEKPWLPNEHAPDGVGAGVPYQSCVPVGEYDLVLRDSPQHGKRWHLVNESNGVFLDESDNSKLRKKVVPAKPVQDEPSGKTSGYARKNGFN